MNREESERKLLSELGVDPDADWSQTDREAIIAEIRRLRDALLAKAKE
jgi:hypothetical protein